MELSISHFLTETDPFEFSASIAERGRNAGPETWANATAEGAQRPLISTPADIETARFFFAEFGAWDAAERAAWSDAEINALLIQLISGDVREAQSLCPGDGPGGIDWESYEEMSSEGIIGGRMFLGKDGVVYFCVGGYVGG